MPSQKTAALLVSEVRDWLQIFDPAVLRDGFGTDPVDDDGQPYRCTAILPWINNAWTDILATGINKCLVNFTVNQTSAEWGLSNEVNEIVHVTLDGIPLERISLLGKDGQDPGWQNFAGNNPRRPGRPTAYYTYGDVLGVDPIPDKAYVLSILADTIPLDLVNPEDVPVRIPARYHSALSAKAAMYLNDMVEIENPVSRERVSQMMAIWTKAYTELRDIANDRGDDARSNQIIPSESRSFWQR